VLNSDSNSDSSDSTVSTHRAFLLGLNVASGPALAIVRGGHPQPSPEVMEKEVEDVLKHYLVMEKSGVRDTLVQTSTIMARLTDPYNRDTLDHIAYMAHVFSSFFMSNMKILIDNGVVALTNPPAIEKTWTLSTEHTFLDEELADLDTWNNMMKSSVSNIFETDTLDDDDDDDDDGQWAEEEGYDDE
jgi:hypothetical protein